MAKSFVLDYEIEFDVLDLVDFRLYNLVRMVFSFSEFDS